MLVIFGFLDVYVCVKGHTHTDFNMPAELTPQPSEEEWLWSREADKLVKFMGKARLLHSLILISTPHHTPAITRQYIKHASPSARALFFFKIAKMKAWLRRVATVSEGSICIYNI